MWQPQECRFLLRNRSYKCFAFKSCNLASGARLKSSMCHLISSPTRVRHTLTRDEREVTSWVTAAREVVQGVHRVGSSIPSSSCESVLGNCKVLWIKCAIKVQPFSILAIYIISVWCLVLKVECACVRVCLCVRGESGYWQTGRS